MEARPPSLPQIGQWERFERALKNTHPYGDPYRDVTLETTFTRPDRSLVRFEGFYDGNKTWRFRFKPDQLGRWTYVARFLDGRGEACGAFECVPSEVPGMLDVYGPNPIWFGYRGDGPALLRSFHVGDAFFARNFPQAKRTAFLDWAQAQGYNALSVASHYLNRDAPGRGRGWDTPSLWPLNPTAYDELEAHLDDLAARGMLVFPFAGFFGRDSGYPKSEADQALYVRYCLARLGAYWHILLNVAGPEPLLKNKPFMSFDQVAALAAMIRQADVFGHPLTVHNPTGDDAFRDEPWTDFGTLQGPKTQDLEALSSGLLRAHHPNKPLYAQETLWSGNKYHPAYTDEELRRNAWVILFSGAMINFADNGGSEVGSVGDSSSGFSGTMNLADRRQDRHDILRQVWDVFAKLPFHQLRPRQDLVDRGYCLADPGRFYAVYLPDGGAVDLSLVAGDYRASWLSPRDPDDRRPCGVVDRAYVFSAPAEDEDWLLWLAATDNTAAEKLS